MFALLCSHAALYLFGMFCGMMINSRNKLTRNQREYREAHAREMHHKMNDRWDHPGF